MVCAVGACAAANTVEQSRFRPLLEALMILLLVASCLSISAALLRKPVVALARATRGGSR